MEPPAKPSPSSSSPSSTFPKLSVLDPSKPHTFARPAKRINEGPDVARFLVSQAYRDIGLFVLQLNRALCPRKKPAGEGGPGAQTFTLATKRDDPPAVTRLRELLDKVAALVDEAPPDPGPRRFGNVSFRKWYALLEERVGDLLKEYVAPEMLGFAGPQGGGDGEKEEEGEAASAASSSGGGDGVSAMVELKSYFLGAFGSAQRLDYGTGHELSFLAFLGCLWKLGAFGDGKQSEDVERSIVLGVFEPYLKVVRKLILTYTLEPAGSHGVWGLDDHSFMPYIFGSAQLTRPITENEAMPQEGSVLRAPKTADVLKPTTVEVQRELNMYFSAIGFIHDVKKGPFWEHSPILYDVSGIKDGWGKINKGMIKMFNAEVLSKFPVVQHFHFGSLFSWDQDPDAAAPVQSVHMANQPTAMPTTTTTTATTTAMPPPAAGGGTAAPWAQAVRMPGPAGPGIPYSRVPPPPSAAVGDATATSQMRRPPPPPPAGPDSAAAPSAGMPGAVTRAPWAKGP